MCRFVRTALSPDGDYFLSGAADGTAHIWEVRYQGKEAETRRIRHLMHSKSKEGENVCREFLAQATAANATALPASWMKQFMVVPTLLLSPLISPSKMRRKCCGT
jgi:WD40 repeat protein